MRNDTNWCQGRVCLFGSWVFRNSDDEVICYDWDTFESSHDFNDRWSWEAGTVLESVIREGLLWSDGEHRHVSVTLCMSSTSIENATGVIETNIQTEFCPSRSSDNFHSSHQRSNWQSVRRSGQELLLFALLATEWNQNAKDAINMMLKKCKEEVQTDLDCHTSLGHTSMKNRWQFCTCWAFIATGNLTPLNEQQLVDCHGWFDVSCWAHRPRLRFCREGCRVHGDRSQPHLNKGYLQDFELRPEVALNCSATVPLKLRFFRCLGQCCIRVETRCSKTARDISGGTWSLPRDGHVHARTHVDAV